jgi:AAA+ superfamily predicted ATPase
MSDRPTPETDAEFHRIRTSPSIFVSDEMDSLAVLTRKLERQRDEARELARDLLAEMQRLSRWEFPIYGGDSGIIAEIDSVISEFQSKEVLP